MEEEIKIIIVDDDENDIKALTDAIQQYSTERKVVFSVTVYQDAVLFSDEMKDVKADIIFLDICMPQITGMELAHKLREVNQTINIIFSTNMAQYAVEGYAVNAIDFLLKPIHYEGLKRALSRAVNAVESNIQKNICINDKVSKQTVVLPMTSIMYIEVGKHCLTYYTTQGVYEEWNSLKEIANKLSSRCFGRCHTSFLIGFKYIRAIRGDDVLIKGTEKALPISRTYKKDFLIAFAKYMRS